MRLCRKHLVQSQPQSISLSGAMPSPVGSGVLCRDSTVTAGTGEGWSTHSWAGMRGSAKVSEWTEMRWTWLGEGNSKGNSRSKGLEAGQRVKRLGAVVMDEAGFVQGETLSNPRLSDRAQTSPRSETDMQLGMLWAERLLGLVHLARRLLGL